MSDNTTDSLLCIGELKSAYGIKGWLWVYSHTDPIDKVFDYSPWRTKASFLHSKSDEPSSFDIEQWRKQGKGLIVKLKGVNDRNAAEKLCHTKLYIEKNDLQPLADDEYYWSELTGMRVVSANSKDVDFGYVAQMTETAAHPLLHVSPDSLSSDEEDRLIPWHTSIIMDVDREQGIIKVDWELDY